MAKKTTSMIEISPQSFKDMIYTFRGQQVMVDSDLAAIYGYETKTFNQQIKNNVEKFDDDFMFQLSDEETFILRSKFLTSNEGNKDCQEVEERNADELRCKKSFSNKRGGRRYNPYVFTEQGVYMLMTVLKGSLAVQQSKQLMRLFKQIYSLAKQSIYVIDNYIGIKTLALLKDVPTDVSVTIISDNSIKKLRKSEYDDFVREYPYRSITMITAGGIFHDRYIVIDYNTSDEKIYHCGASSKDGGNKVMTLNLIMDTAIYHPLIDNTMHNPPLQLT